MEPISVRVGLQSHTVHPSTPDPPPPLVTFLVPKPRISSSSHVNPLHKQYHRTRSIAPPSPAVGHLGHVIHQSAVLIAHTVAASVDVLLCGTAASPPSNPQPPGH